MLGRLFSQSCRFQFSSKWVTLSLGQKGHRSWVLRHLKCKCRMGRGNHDMVFIWLCSPWGVECLGSVRNVQWEAWCWSVRKGWEQGEQLRNLRGSATPPQSQLLCSCYWWWVSGIPLTEIWKGLFAEGWYFLLQWMVLNLSMWTSDMEVPTFIPTSSYWGSNRTDSGWQIIVPSRMEDLDFPVWVVQLKNNSRWAEERREQSGMVMTGSDCFGQRLEPGSLIVLQRNKYRSGFAASFCLSGILSLKYTADSHLCAGCAGWAVCVYWIFLLSAVPARIKGSP